MSTLKQYEILIAASMVAAAILIAGAMNRYTVTSGEVGAFRMDGLTGEVAVCFQKRGVGTTRTADCGTVVTLSNY